MQKKKGLTVSRTSEELKQIFPHYPTLEDGYLKCYQPNEAQEYREAMDKYGFVVVKVLSEKECDDTIPDFLEDANSNPNGHQIKKVSLVDPSTWERENWPSKGKFMFSNCAFGQKAFDNRTNGNVYQVFCNLFQENKLWCSIDKWGVMRGTKNMKFIENGETVFRDRPDWHYELKMHWDVNPWLYTKEMEENHHKMYQGLVALVDCPEEVGGFICVPGSTKFLPQWTREKPPINDKPLSVQVPSDDVMLQYAQRVPLRKGEMVIWDSGQAHANFANTCDKPRVYQFIRMCVACDRCKERDRFSSPRVLNEDALRENVSRRINLTPLGRKLVSLDTWE